MPATASRRTVKSPKRKRPVGRSTRGRPPRVSITAFWENCLKREIPNQPAGWLKVIKGVVESKRKARIPGWDKVSVHDAACGTGRVMEHLHQQGVPISGSDASLSMLLHQSHRDAVAAVRGDFNRPRLFQRSWTELPGYFSERVRKQGPLARPKIMIVPGSSIPYAGAWDGNPATRKPAVREQSIRAALNGFRESIRPGGVLILTTTPDKSFREIKQKGPEVETYKTKIHGETINVTEKITHDPRTKTRKWVTVLTFPNGEKQILTRNAFMLPRSELKKMLREIGFLKIKNIDVPGETGHYDGVIAEVP